MSHAKHVPGRTCCHCTRPLVMEARSGGAATYGYRGDGLFCGLVCAYEYATARARAANKVPQ